jgi:nucleotide-binding universal stress UspA family protein
MRVLLATDGSASANRARDLVDRIPWPEGTTIRVVAALANSPELFGLPWLATVPINAPQIERELLQQIDNALEGTVRSLTAPGRVVQRLILRGRPASAILEEAREWNADLVVVGHRGLGPMETILLGSVSAEVVDHAPCPVLVVRRPSWRSVLLATDGSPSARLAEELVASWPIFADLPVAVVSVAETTIPWSTGLAPALYEGAFVTPEEELNAALQHHRAVADEAVGRLAAAGRRARAVVLEGDPAGTLVRLAAKEEIDVIVLGTRGHTGLARLLLGSVARNVLLHADSSVLVVREKARVARPSAPEEAATVLGDRL